MQEDKYRQLHIDFELTNNINTAKRMIKSLPGDKFSILRQIITLLEYKYLSENAKNNDDDIGYSLNEDLYYENLLLNKGNVIDSLKAGIEQITQDNDNVQAADVFYDLFNIVDFETFNDNDSWLLLIDIVEKLCSETMATLGEIIIFITRYITYKFGKKGGFKPTEDIIKLMALNQEDVKNLYDPFTDEATLLAEIGNVINVKNYYGQHPNKEKCAIAKMTLLANNVNYKNIFIKCNDILEPIDWNVKFDLCVSIPPFGSKLKVNGHEDKRFNPYAPKSEFVYLLDMLYNLDDDGTIKMIVPNGVLFTSPDKKIRKHLVDNELISSIIALPAGLFNLTSIPTTMLIINKKHTNKGIYYLNTMNTKTKKELQRKVVSILDIEKYLELLSNKKEQKLISKIVTIDEIRENDYNLSINRYIHLELDVIDIEKTVAKIKELKMDLKFIDEKLNEKLEGLFK